MKFMARMRLHKEKSSGQSLGKSGLSLEMSGSLSCTNWIFKLTNTFHHQQFLLESHPLYFHQTTAAHQMMTSHCPLPKSQKSLNPNQIATNLLSLLTPTNLVTPTNLLTFFLIQLFHHPLNQAFVKQLPTCLIPRTKPQ
jgi:hypothetical protein